MLDTVFKQLKDKWVSDVVFDFEKGTIHAYESYRDQSLPRSLGIGQGLVTTFLNWLPGAKLLTYPPEAEVESVCGLNR